MPVAITQNTSIDYDVYGEGPPLILINGFGRWGFFKQIPILSRHFSTITIDVRGERDLNDGVSDPAADNGRYTRGCEAGCEGGSGGSKERDDEGELT